MAWTESQLAAAFNALSPAPASLSAGLATLVAQTVTEYNVVPTSDIASYLGVQGKLSATIAWAATATGAAGDAAQDLVFAFQHSATVPAFDMTVPTTRTAMQDALAAMVAASGCPLTSTDESAILAMAQSTVPKWQPAPVVADLQRCQALGLISSSIPVI